MKKSRSNEILNQINFISEMTNRLCEDVKNILLNNGFEQVEIEKDLAGIDRVISAKLK